MFFCVPQYITHTLSCPFRTQSRISFSDNQYELLEFDKLDRKYYRIEKNLEWSIRLYSRAQSPTVAITLVIIFDLLPARLFAWLDIVRKCFYFWKYVCMCVCVRKCTSSTECFRVWCIWTARIIRKFALWITIIWIASANFTLLNLKELL